MARPLPPMAPAPNDGPGLEGLFLGGQPVYHYMGPIDMSSVVFTESALNRAVNPVYNLPLNSDNEGELDVLAFGDAKKGVQRSKRAIATGDRFIHNAKFLNDIYELTKKQTALRSPWQAEHMAPLVLTDKNTDKGLAYYSPSEDRIVHPVYENLNFENLGYYSPKSRDVVVGSRSSSPQYATDSFVNQMTGERIPVINTAIAHEVAHSMDFFDGAQMSANEKLLWPHITKDFYYHPRTYRNYGRNANMPVSEVFAEYMADAMRTNLAESSPQLREQYESDNRFFPYEMSDSLEKMRFTGDTPETKQMMFDLSSQAASEGLKPFAYYPSNDERGKREKAQVDSAKDAKEIYELLMTKQSDKEYAKQSAQTKRAQGHLNFLDWYFPFRDQ